MCAKWNQSKGETAGHHYPYKAEFCLLSSRKCDLRVVNQKYIRKYLLCPEETHHKYPRKHFWHLPD